MKQVQIDEELFIALYSYFFFDGDENDLERIKTGLEAKMERLAMHEAYSNSKNPNLTAEEREKARQSYLDARGIHKDFRW